MLKVLQTPPSKAVNNMQLDEKLLQELDQSKEPILHLYGWKSPSITYGYFIRPEKMFHLDKVQKYSFDLARRSTGGGVVFHCWDFAFSFLLPSTDQRFSMNTLENYRFVNRVVLQAVQSCIQEKDLTLTPEDFPLTHLPMKHFCMARPTKYDVLLHGRKVAGAAQRKTKKGYLHQGTISLTMPDEKIVKEILLDRQIYEAMVQHSFYLCSQDELEKQRNQIKQALIKSFSKEFNQVMTV